MTEMHDRFAVGLDFPGEPPAPNMNEMKKRLDLTPEQVTKTRKI